MLTVTNIETARNDEAISSKFNVRGILNWCEIYTQTPNCSKYLCSDKVVRKSR